jgi:hypothetical protein
MGRACTVATLTIAGLGLYLSARCRFVEIQNMHAKMLCSKSAVFLAGVALWPALCVASVCELESMSSLVLVTFLLVLGYLTLEVGSLKDYSGSFDALEGSTNLFFERSTQIVTVSFAVGTLLVSQKDIELSRRLGPVVFLSLLFAILPSLAVGQTARRRVITNPELGAVQRLSASFAIGLLCMTLAVSVEHMTASGQLHKW